MVVEIKSKTNKDLGFVGDIENVDIALLNTLSSNGYIPVISSVGRNKEGETLNMNADHCAEAIASAIKASKLIYLTDVRGVKVDGEFIGRMALEKAKDVMKHPDIKGGMLPKLACSIKAIEQGVDQVHIIDGNIKHTILLEIFTDVGIGSMIQT